MEKTHTGQSRTGQQRSGVGRRPVRELIGEWSRSGDEGRWLREFCARRGWGRFLAHCCALGGLVMALAALLNAIVGVQLAYSSSRMILWICAMVGVVWALRWLGPWPSQREIIGLVIVGDITIGAACLQHSDRITGIAGISFFAILGVVVALFSTPSVQAVHLTVTGAVLVVLLVLLAREQGFAILVGVGLSKALGEMMVCAGLPVVQFGYWVMRTNSDDSLCDPLTGVANRRGLDDHLARLDAESGAHPVTGDACGVMLVDVDDFKHVNDTFGHGAGDAVLTRVAAVLTEVFGPEALIARVGGDEFVVIGGAATTASGRAPVLPPAPSVRFPIRRSRYRRESPPRQSRCRPTCSTSWWNRPTRPCTGRRAAGARGEIPGRRRRTSPDVECRSVRLVKSAGPGRRRSVVRGGRQSEPGEVLFHGLAEEGDHVGDRTGFGVELENL